MNADLHRMAISNDYLCNIIMLKAPVHKKVNDFKLLT